MLSVTLNRIRPGSEPRLRAWLEEMSSRRDEVVATFRSQGVRHVQAFIVQGADGPRFLMVAEIEDPVRARAAFRDSEASIDAEYKRVMADALEDHVDDVPVYECTADPAP